DYIIVDCRACIELGFQNALAGGDEAIVVTTPEKSRVRGADRTVGLIEQHEIDRTSLVINRIRNHMMLNGEMLDIEDVVQILSIELLGIVVDSDDVTRASNSGETIAFEPNSTASIAYRNIARRILGETVPLRSLEKEKTVF